MSPIDFNGLDTAVHGPVRLGALTVLHLDGPLDFTTLKKRLRVVDGVLGLHLRTLEQARYITASRSFIGNRPKTTYRITPIGRRALRSYLGAMQAVITAIQESDRS